MLDTLARRLASVQPAALCARAVPTKAGLDAARAEHERIRGRMIALQEELDWEVYRCYGLLDDDEAAELTPKPENVPEVKPGERAFEIVLARQVQRGEAGDAMVRPAPLHADHGDPEALAPGVPGCRDEAYRDNRAAQGHQPYRAARVQAPLASRALGTGGARSAHRLAAVPM